MSGGASFPTKLTKTSLFTICAICWVLQSLPAFNLYMDGREIVQQKHIAASHLVLPQLLFCNRFPFTQAGLASLGQQFNRDSVLAYLRQWLDPSLGAAPPDDPLAGPLADADRQQAEQTIAQLLPNGRLKQRLEQLMPQCQDMVSSCVLSGRQLGGFDCCRMVQPWLATPRAGICWPFVGNLSSAQSPLDFPRGMQITFQISRNSFLSSALSAHPGIDVYLVAPEMHNRLRMATTLGDGFPLSDKRALRMDIRREINNQNDMTTLCHGSAEIVQKGQLVAGGSAGLLCMLEKAIDRCSCVPMLVVLWTLQNDLDNSFLRRFNASTICTVGEFDHCVRPYIEFAVGPDWAAQLYAVPDEASKEFKEGLEECKKSPTSVACQSSQFPARTAERDLPVEYRNTQDFVTRVSVSFNSFVVTELNVIKQMDLYQLLSTLGLNLWWFAIGHLLWSVCRFRCVQSANGKGAGSGLGSTNRVDPKSPMIPPASAVAVIASTTTANNEPRSQQNSRGGTGGGGGEDQPMAPGNVPMNNNTNNSNGTPPAAAVQQQQQQRARQLPPLAIPARQSGSGNGTIGSFEEEEREQKQIINRWEAEQR